jgi:hypothetical protein
MVAEVVERVFTGDGAVSPASATATDAWAGFTARAVETSPGLAHPDVLRPDRNARAILVAIGDDLARWDLEARTERTYWETGAQEGRDMVRVTASGWADASVWRLRGGLSGVQAQAFAQGGTGDGMMPGPLLGVMLEQAVTGSSRFGTAAGHAVAGVETPVDELRREQGQPPRKPEPDADAAAAADASRVAGAGGLEGIPGVPGADGVRGLSGDELLGAMTAARRQANRAEWARLAVIAEFARRRYAETRVAMDRGDPVGQRPGEFFCEEVSWAAAESTHKAEEQVELAVSMAVRLPCLGGRLAEGALDAGRLLVVHRATTELSVENARLVDAMLAPDAPGLTTEALRKRAWRLVLKLEPEAAAKRRKKAKKKQRVEMWMEESGNAAFAGRELDPEDALAANAYYDAVARTLRKAGLPGTLRELRHLVFVHRNTGRDPLSLIEDLGGNGLDADRAAGGGDGAAPNGADASDADAQDVGAPDAGTVGATGGNGGDWDEASGRAEELRDDGYRADEPWHGLDALGDDSDDDDDQDDDDDDDRGDGGDTGDGGPGGPGGPDVPGPSGTDRSPGGAAAASKPSGSPAPAANIHLLVSAGTVLGWSTTPGEVSGLSGPLDAEASRDLVRSAARNPATRWHVTLVDDESGQAVAHACARGRHSWEDIARSVQTVQTVPDGAARQAGLAEQSAIVAGLLDELGITECESIARGSCDHVHQEDRYVPSRKLGDLVRARTAECPAPCCGSSAVGDDLDHTVSWPDGATDECNLAPPCRRHHRVKQAPGWHLAQESPGEMRWTTPSGRTYDTHPTRYDL